MNRLSLCSGSNPSLCLSYSHRAVVAVASGGWGSLRKMGCAAHRAPVLRGPEHPSWAS